MDSRLTAVRDAEDALKWWDELSANQAYALWTRRGSPALCGGIEGTLRRYYEIVCPLGDPRYSLTLSPRCGICGRAKMRNHAETAAKCLFASGTFVWIVECVS